MKWLMKWLAKMNTGIKIRIWYAMCRLIKILVEVIFVSMSEIKKLKNKYKNK